MQSLSQLPVRPADRRQTPRGVTLIEMLVVIGIIGTLMALLLPGIQAARAAAARTQCQNNLRQIGTAIYAHASAHDCLPGGGHPSLTQQGGGLALQPRAISGSEPAKEEHQTWGWAYQILPYLEQQNRWKNPDDELVRGSLVEVYLCPARDRTSTQFNDARTGLIHYVASACSNCDLPVRLTGNGNPPGKGKGIGWGNSGGSLDGAFPPDPVKPRWLEHVKDGLSNTVFLAEKRWLTSDSPCNNSIGWVSGSPVIQGNTVYGYDTLFSGIEGGPALDEKDPGVQCTSRAGTPHPGGCNVLYGDGSVRCVSSGVNANLWRAQLSINGGEDIDFANDELLSP